MVHRIDPGAFLVSRFDFSIVRNQTKTKYSNWNILRVLNWLPMKLYNCWLRRKTLCSFWIFGQQSDDQQNTDQSLVEWDQNQLITVLTYLLADGLILQAVILNEAVTRGCVFFNAIRWMEHSEWLTLCRRMLPPMADDMQLKQVRNIWRPTDWIRLRGHSAYSFNYYKTCFCCL